MEEIEKEIKKADKLYDNSKFFEASFSYQAILKDIQGKKIPDETKNHIKNRLKESILGSKNEYKELSSQATITEEMIEQINLANKGIIEKIGNDLSNLLPLMFSATFICSSKHTEETAKKTIPLTYQITSMSEHTDKGYLSANNDDYTPLELWFFRMYEMEQMMKIYFHVNPILKQLVENKILNSENFTTLLKNKGLMNNNDLSTLIHGFEVYIDGDYISALHILVPQFENLLLVISEKAGMQTTAIERGRTITKRITLSELTLKSEEMIKILSKDYCDYLRFALYSPLGLSIRHKIAHGTILKEECNINSCNIILVALFILLNRVEKI